MFYYSALAGKVLSGQSWYFGYVLSDYAAPSKAIRNLVSVQPPKHNPFGLSRSVGQSKTLDIYFSQVKCPFRENVG